MKRTVGMLLAGLKAICKAGTIIAFAVLIAVVTIQVLGRLPGFPSPAWTEEVARFALLHMVAFSCGLAVLRGDLVNVDLFTASLPARARRQVERVADVITMLFSLAVIPGAYAYVSGSIGERARSLDAPMLIVYVTVLIIPVALAIFSLARLFGFGQPMRHEELI
ncbi:TRAP transporter small permease subunit [Mesorhizobium sp. B2-1-8]|uniref:TRAP transporter small permease n=1 Tax=unclassified Mesorhizobium TaxID=325217 RepID=UPI0011260D40|nr:MULTISPECIES: TRAP transporter small permease subunit [unclassified Mesorhizobium]MBZ9668496.1 TRAP transporter small permease subunit [Mesorhizobium sp. ES1-3]MBZ9708865.1 TRAP transporter small permease subunit [Mesorhizobium sp. ESP7-2]TPI35136.1 TRAP transporter small permease subunit [Mesorhizobium sp. B3-2-1]UCI18960.1 TRAP transporter small permease subunit [Mesorhizobium sp. B2-1-8]